MIAARLKAWEPKGAIKNEPKPVIARIGFALVLKPSFLSINKPGIYCPVKVIKNKGKATLNVAFIEKAGSVKIGYANLSSNPEKSICD